MLKAFCSVLCVILLGLSLATAQTRDDVEKRISALPADQRAYQRFRLWVTAQPVDMRGSIGDPTVLERYRAFLTEGGYSAEEIAAQIQAVRQEGSRLEAEHWNRYLLAEHPTFNTKPNAFLVAMVKGRTPGRALDVAMGQGRNTVWLAQQGWEVTGFDPADEAVAFANKTAAQLGVKITTAIARGEDFDFGEQRWDLIVLSYAGCGQWADKLQRALKPGGILVEEAFHVDATIGRRIGGSICGTGELPRLFQDLRTVHYEEPIATPDFAQEPMRVVRFCAEKPVR